MPNKSWTLESMADIDDLVDVARATTNRIDPRREDGGLGTGVGPVIRVVDMNEGMLEASSASGPGSEFAVSSFPSPEYAPFFTLTSASTDIPPATESSLRVLIVDDDLDSVTTMGMLLEHSGYQVLTAHTGPTAVAAAIEHRPDVMLMDIGLPGFDGYEVAKRIRSQPLLSNTIIVAMSGYAPDSDPRRTAKVEIDHHLTKPADFECVRKILASLLTRATCTP